MLHCSVLFKYCLSGNFLYALGVLGWCSTAALLFGGRHEQNYKEVCHLTPGAGG